MRRRFLPDGGETDVRRRLAGKLPRDSVFLLFMTLVLAYMLYHLYLTLGYDQESTKTFPLIVLSVTIVIVLADICLRVFSHRVPDEFQKEDEDETAETPETAETEASVQPRRLAIGVLWSVTFLVGILYIGFFTSVFLFTVGYSWINYDSVSPVRRFAIASIWGAFITGFIWVLFVEFLKVSSVFNFGFFI
jgi:hypothetical protein